MIRVFKSRVIMSVLSDNELDLLVDDFTRYKTTGIAPDNFGRDVPYDHPNTLPIIKQEEVAHIHLGNEEIPLPFHKMQFYRTSDTHLVYCQGALNEDAYLLMTVLKPNAHDLAKSRDIMFQLGRMAELFRLKY